ncbi:PREDICTED: nucleolar protein 14 [Papilio xuthus]|uniref:Nucleolar protein 14 n=1 Tax=Papilio xuthus TaxID=66420 RepID=A0AAJ7E782_PAPXU|nr:PREDICTED: nucleolar protein 14 [Papilio xuthus]XP_013165720.1 PREDICTED: nucleolar protein 14 [Papilio xuthus]
MAKVKNKRNSSKADKVHAKRKTEANKKKLNPFEVHINREKLKVLGKKSKHDRGLPGVSRAKAIQKRKDTLGVEMKVMNKTNAFIDRRIGEKNTQLSAEDRMIARFAAERAKQHSKKNIYNLADDEILTHRGQTLEQIEKFDDPRSDDEDEEGGKRFGGLDDEFVSDGHFGGGILSKTDAQDGAKSHKDLIEQLIAESKKRKAEKQKEKEQTLDLTEKLDSEWKDLQPVVFKKARVEESLIDKLLSKADKGQDYDKMMRELKFEKRGTPSDGLKSTEKQEAEERKKLEELERQREQRMLPEEEANAPKTNPTALKHRSADDLDDNFVLEDEKEFMLAYDKEGKPLVPEHVLKDFTVPNAKPKFNDGISDTSSEGEEGSEDDDENEEGSESDEGTNENEKVESVNEEDNKKEKSITDNNLIANIGSEASVDESDDDDEEISDEKSNDKDNELNKLKVNGVSKEEESENCDDESGDDDESNKNDEFDDLRDLKESEDESDDEMLEESSQKIDSFFDLKSEEGTNLKELLTGKSPSQQSAALQKIIKSYDPSLSENNKELLSRLYAHMLQYVNDIFSNLNDEGEIMKSFLIFDKLVPHFYDLAHTNKVSAKKFICDLLKEKHDKFKKNPKKVPDLDTLIFFKLVSLLYPTSDFRHPVTTPSLIFMSEILTYCRFKDAYSVSRGFFVAALILEYTALSKRFVPAAVNFLRGILYLSANTSVLNPIQVVPPFRLHKDVKILNLEDDCSKVAFETKMSAKDLIRTDIDDAFKITCLLTCVLMLKELFDNYNDLEAQEAIFEAHIKLLGRLDLDLYPKKVRSTVSEVLQHMKESLEVKTYTPLAREKVRPKALRLYEPDIQEVFTGSKSSKLSREKAEKARLQSKYKKEMKGALREIRRDKAYIASVKIKQKIHSDNIRKEKVKQIYKDASIQQGELNKLKRMK